MPVPPVDLRLCAPRVATPGAVNLDLLATDPCGPAAGPNLPPLVADIDIRTLYTVALDATPTGLSADLIAEFDLAVWRGVGSLHDSRWQPAHGSPSVRAAVWSESARQRTTAATAWGAGLPRKGAMQTAWEESIRLRTQALASFAEALSRGSDSAIRWQTMLRTPRPLALAAWQIGAARLTATASGWQERHRRPRPFDLAEWQTANPIVRAWLSAFQPGSFNRSDWMAPWGEGLDRYGWGVALPRPPDPPPPTQRCYFPLVGFANLDLRDSIALDRLTLNFICRNDPGATLAVPRLRTYIVIHDIEVYRLPDMTPIHAASVNLTLDVDSYSWGFDATLLGAAALDAIQPAQDGTPVTLAVEINGHVWHVLAEQWREDRQHGKRAVQVSGRGLSAWLDAPYVIPSSGETTAALTMQQMIEAHLPLGSGWTVDWTAPDWLVPAGAWSWQEQAPIQAIHAALHGVGLIALPARNSKTLKVQPRYPVLPWDFDTTTPALSIPDTAILSMSRRQTANAQANAVYVHGSEVGGVLAYVKRTGTAGDIRAATTQHQLIVHADAARSLGGRILAGQQRQPDIKSLTVPLGGVYPLANIGQLLRVDNGASQTRGIINAVAVEASRSASGVSVRQTITIGEETPNAWAQFNALLPRQPLLSGVIDAVYGDGTVSVQLPDGGSLRVRGSGSVGASAYVKDGAVVGLAPSLPLVAIDV